MNTVIKIIILGTGILGGQLLLHLDYLALYRGLMLATIIIGGGDLAFKGFRALLQRQIGLNLLMTIAVTGAILLGELFEGALVLFLFNIGSFLESRAVEKTRSSVEDLLALSPLQARVIKSGGQEEKCLVENVPIGSTILIKPGERIPLDGQVKTGEAWVDQSAITGEAGVVFKANGDEVFSGSVLENGFLEVKTTRTASNSTLARVARLVEEAQDSKGPRQRFMDRFAALYTPWVIAFSIAIMLVPPLLLGLDFRPWVYRGLALLIVACPCAMVISIPVAIVTALGRGAREGILIKGGQYLEILGNLKAMAFDKTGTLTRGQPVIAKVYCVSGWSRDEVLSLAASVEARSQHPLARAVLKEAEASNVSYKTVKNFSNYEGLGASGGQEENSILIGSPKFMEYRQVDTRQLQEKEQRLDQSGLTPAYVAKDGRAVGLLGALDPLQEDAHSMLREIKKLGLEEVVILTGDRNSVASSMARDLEGIKFAAELLPQDKQRLISEMSRSYGNVAMVGDGINDAPALARAPVGMAIGVRGSHIAMESAGVVIMGEGIGLVARALHLGKEALSIIRQNIVLSIGLKVLALFLISAGFLGLWMAVLADTGVTLLVVLNSLRLNYIKF